MCPRSTAPDWRDQDWNPGLLSSIHDTCKGLCVGTSQSPSKSPTSFQLPESLDCFTRTTRRAERNTVIVNPTYKSVLLKALSGTDYTSITWQRCLYKEYKEKTLVNGYFNSTFRESASYNPTTCFCYNMEAENVYIFKWLGGGEIKITIFRDTWKLKVFPSSVSINKVWLKHHHTHLFIVYGCFGGTVPGL